MESIASLLAGLPPEKRLELRLQVLLARYTIRSNEVLHRVITRITIIVVSLASATAFLSGDAGWRSFAGVLLFMVLGGMWLQNDRRIGEDVRENKMVELQLREFDGLEGFESLLEVMRKERVARWLLERTDFTSWTMRLFYPGIQSVMLVMGVAEVWPSITSEPWKLAGMWLFVAVDVFAIVMTFVNVRYIRKEPEKPAAN